MITRRAALAAAVVGLGLLVAPFDAEAQQAIPPSLLLRADQIIE